MKNWNFSQRTKTRFSFGFIFRRSHPPPVENTVRTSNFSLLDTQTYEAADKTMTDWSERVTLSHEKLKFLPKNQNWLGFVSFSDAHTPLPLKIPSEHQTSASWTHQTYEAAYKTMTDWSEMSLYHMKSWNFSQRTKTGLVSFHFPMLTSPPPPSLKAISTVSYLPRRVMKSFPIMGQTKGTHFFYFRYYNKEFFNFAQNFLIFAIGHVVGPFPWRLPVQWDRCAKIKKF